MVTRTEKHQKDFKKVKKIKFVYHSKRVLFIFSILLFIIILTYLYLRFLGTSFIQSKEYIVKNENIPASFHGVKILHFSDILYGSTIFKKDLISLNQEIDRINPDIVIFTGDIIDKNYSISKEEINFLNEFFKNITYKIGKYAVKGELDTSTFDLITENTGFNILNNQAELIYNNDIVPIMINGIIDNSTNYQLDNSNNYYVITIIHNFDYYNNSIKSNLILAGHNLNGEIFIPYNGGVFGNNRYNGSYYEINNTPIYISNGLGSIHKLRMFNHPSINIYRLYSN